MGAELSAGNESLVAGAVAIGAVGGILATFLLFPLIDRFARKKFRLDRSVAMGLLLAGSVLVGIGTGVAGFFWLRGQQPVPVEESVPVRANEDSAADLTR